MATRIILHGKQVENEALREAVTSLRSEGHELHVRVTWEADDARLLAAEAAREGLERVIAGGGDGTVNEVLTGLLGEDFGGVMGVLPLGTANDFATSAGISDNLEDALRVAVAAAPAAVDVGVNRFGDSSRPFLNVATGGFGAEVTANTDPNLKKYLGGAAYVLTGVQRFGALKGAECRVRTPDGDWEGELLVLAIGNGRQAGGGHPLCPDALLDDGLLDVAVLPLVQGQPVYETLGMLLSPNKGEMLERTAIRGRVPWVEVSARETLTVNLDGEPVLGEHHRFEALGGALKLALPERCPLLKGTAP